jgi:hypothetical protein
MGLDTDFYVKNLSNKALIFKHSKSKYSFFIFFRPKNKEVKNEAGFLSEKFPNCTAESLKASF